MSRKSSIRMVLAAMVVGLSPPLAIAQSFPARAVRMIVPHPAGGLGDITTRALAERLSRRWGQPVIIENKPGASTSIATQLVARAEPDGYTLLIAERSSTINPFIISGLSYNFARDLQPIAKVFVGSLVLAVPTASRFNTVQELLATAREKPNSLNYASFGKGSFSHLDTEAMLKKTGVTATHVPYKGIAEVMTALQSGEVDFGLTSAGLAAPLARSGKLKVLAYLGGQRYPDLPHVPSATELNLVNSSSWGGVFAPAGTPSGIVEKIARDIELVVAEPGLADNFRKLGLTMAYMAPGDFASFLIADREYTRAIVKDIDLKAD